MRAWRCCLVSLAVLATGCAAPSPHRGEPAPAALPAAAAAGDPCRTYVDAWVRHFRSHVAFLDGTALRAAGDELDAARATLQAAGRDEADCERPYCVVQPRGEGRLDSYCGYRRATPGGEALYRWEPYR